MSLSLFLKLLHVLTSFWFVCGLIGRGVTYWQAGRATNLTALDALLTSSEFFERAMVIPGGQLVILFGLVTAWVQGWPILGFLQGSPVNWLLVSLILVLASVPLVAFGLLPRAKIRRAVLERARAEGGITPELAAAVHDRVVFQLRALEFLMIVFVIYLMVIKPF